MKKRLIVVGKGGSGKDYMRRSLENCGFKYCVSHTTRPMREGEIDGKDYFFIDLEDLGKHENFSNVFYEWTTFNDWFYGTSLSEFNSSNLFIMTPSGISRLKKEHRDESLIVYLDIEEGIRRKRLESRADSDKTERRIKADNEDFRDFKDFDVIISNPNFSVKEISEILKIYDRNELH